jgi:hypothetical protein
MKFNNSTHPRVRELLILLNHSKRRVRIWYGDQETGKSWNEEHHVTGTIGRSTGETKIPLMIPNRRSRGGMAILDHFIIRIDDINSRIVLWKHPNFHTGLELENCKVYVYDPKLDIYKTQAKFDHPFKARKYLEFMEGKRYHT